MANPPSLLKHVGRVVRDDVDAVELRQSLRRHGDEHARAVPLEHLGIGPLAIGTLYEHIHLDLTEFFPGARILNVPAAIEISDDDNALLIVVVIEQPSGISQPIFKSQSHVARPKALTSVIRQL